MIIGWDIGGAHVKAALLSEQGRLIKVVQQPCPLWKGVPHLQQALSAVMAVLPANPKLHAITMTGELVDCFDSRPQGVRAIVRALQHHFPEQELWLFAGQRRFLKPGDLPDDVCMDIASANWIASAALLASQLHTGLFVDIGSTTTDILLIEDHQLKAQGWSDYQRLASGELIYTGIVRTAVMALTQRAEFNGRSMGLMAEYFATMADVYRLTGDLQETHDQSDTADGGDKTPMASARRLSRLTGYDFCENDWSLWLAFAKHLKHQQREKISVACQRQLARARDHQQQLMVGAGVGRFLIAEIATELGLPYRDFAELLPASDHDDALVGSDCAPAVAVACLAQTIGESALLG